MMRGKLFGVGVGPGDGELLTIKGYKVIKNCDIIAVPHSGRNVNTALEIVREVIDDIDTKELIMIKMPMTKNVGELEEAHARGVMELKNILDLGKNIAFLTLGDPSVYSTYTYMHRKIKDLGYDTEIIPGVPAFCAAAAALDMDLGIWDEAIHIIPASSKNFTELLNLCGTRVIMKSGSRLGEIKDILKDGDFQVCMAERCTMSDERLFYCASDIDEKAGYFSTIIVKDGVK